MTSNMFVLYIFFFSSTRLCSRTFSIRWYLLPRQPAKVPETLELKGGERNDFCSNEYSRIVSLMNKFLKLLLRKKNVLQLLFDFGLSQNRPK